MIRALVVFIFLFATPGLANEDGAAPSGAQERDGGFTLGSLDCGSKRYFSNSVYGASENDIEVNNFFLSEEGTGDRIELSLAFSVVNRTALHGNAFVEVLGIRLEDGGFEAPFMFSSNVPLGVGPGRAQSHNEKVISYDGPLLEQAQYVCVRVTVCQKCF